ncbi:putative E3 SUMO-protein ligase PIAS3 [Apostichopus japonicus]|uniref:Putative E3 SUMO-protein ligase PIAS3 n=1 Tax=Stichopus japonicus TaxID=307972 RepID=A0A2G8JUY4_STIJA|nr:putative E3 SUMO-protein ligase PIAS3 [Apostichopus japonicus]
MERAVEKAKEKPYKYLKLGTGVYFFIVMPVKKSLDLIKEIFKCDGSSVAVDNIQIPVVCPYTLKRITIPCRTFACTHINCFDETAFPRDGIKTKWSCPVCGKAAKDKTDVYVDAYFLGVLEQHLVDCDIQIFPDGRWKAMKDEDNGTENNQSLIIINDSIIDLTNDTLIDLTELDATLDN